MYMVAWSIVLYLAWLYVCSYVMNCFKVSNNACKHLCTIV